MAWADWLLILMIQVYQSRGIGISERTDLPTSFNLHFLYLLSAESWGESIGCDIVMAKETVQPTSTDDSSKKEALTELEHTLHQQFAENYNNISGSLMAFVAAMFIVFTGYAYVFSNIKDAPCIFECLANDTKGIYSINALFWANLMLNLTMLVVFYFAVNLGLTQRKEQFITYTIRRNAYGAKGNYELDTNIFPEGYHPFNKKCCSYLVGIYGYIANCALIASFVVSIVTFFFINVYGTELCCLQCNHFYCSFIIIMTMLLFKCHKYCKYQKYNKEFKQKLGIQD